MANQANSREQTLYIVPEPVYGMAAAPVLTDAVMFERFNVGNRSDVIMRRDKTGSRGIAPGSKGRSVCGWDFVGGLTPNPGGPALLPGLHQLLLAGMGAHTVLADTSVTYSLTDTIKSFTSWDYRTPTTMAQRCGAGLVVSSMGFALGGDYLTLSASGEGKYCIYSDVFPTLLPEYKCGLSAFAADPGVENYSDDGALVMGFTGSCNVGAHLLASIRSATSRIMTGNATRKDTINTFCPDGTEGMVRLASTSFMLYDEDGAESTAIRQAADDKVPVTITIVVGFTNGKRFEFKHTGVQLSSYTLDDSAVRWSASVGDSNSSESAPGARDEYTIRIF